MAYGKDSQAARKSTLSNSGVFTISLDFELYWGVQDKREIDSYSENLKGVKSAVEKILQLFKEYQIHTTWAPVGFLFFKDMDELKKNLPDKKVSYSNPALSPYPYIQKSDQVINPFHFAPDLIAQIIDTPHQEIGTHTFSHYYCLEKGQTEESFKSDLAAVINTSQKKDLIIRSFIFPRNQWNSRYLSILNQFGISCFRGNEKGWIYKAVESKNQNPIRRAIRLFDTFFNASGHHIWSLNSIPRQKPYNFPSSRFLRPFSNNLKWMDTFKLRRITQAMTSAAIKKEVFHLWWHPHNFGKHLNENIHFLKKILQHYEMLKTTYEMKSYNMGELSALIERQK